MRAFICFAILILTTASCGSISAINDGGGQGGTTGAGGAGTGGSGGKGSGGAKGSGGQGGQSCDQIQAAYRTALATARDCTAGAANQCQQTAPNALGCNGCTTFVNDSSGLSQFQDEWNQAACDQNQVCTNIACVAPKSATCRANDAGAGSACVDMLLNSAD